MSGVKRLLQLRTTQLQAVPEHFISVPFADENGQPIPFQRSNDLFAVVRRWLATGLFLAYLPSQLLEGAAWFYNENPTEKPCETYQSVRTANAIRGWLGHFTTMYRRSLYAARLGQGFSNIVHTMKLKPTEFKFEEDVTDEDQTFDFSDGVGKISFNLARPVCESLRMDPSHPPSAFQIRFAGAKGVVSVWPGTFPVLIDMLLRCSTPY